MDTNLIEMWVWKNCYGDGVKIKMISNNMTFFSIHANSIPHLN